MDGKIRMREMSALSWAEEGYLPDTTVGLIWAPCCLEAGPKNLNFFGLVICVLHVCGCSPVLTLSVSVTFQIAFFKSGKVSTMSKSSVLGQDSSAHASYFWTL